jgi:hypothetical protein
LAPGFGILCRSILSTSTPKTVWRDMRDAMAEWTFMTVYGSPLQAAIGVDPADAPRPRQAGTSALQWQLVDARIAELKAKMPQGDLREPFVRTISYVLIRAAASTNMGSTPSAASGLRAPTERRCPCRN